jgi:hypothetical protein
MQTRRRDAAVIMITLIGLSPWVLGLTGFFSCLSSNQVAAAICLLAAAIASGLWANAALRA